MEAEVEAEVEALAVAAPAAAKVAVLARAPAPVRASLLRSNSRLSRASLAFCPCSVSAC